MELELWRTTGQTDTHWWSCQWQYERSQAQREVRKARERQQRAMGVDVDKAKADRKRRKAAKDVKAVILMAGRVQHGNKAQSSTDVPHWQQDEQDNDGDRHRTADRAQDLQQDLQQDEQEHMTCSRASKKPRSRVQLLE